MDLFKDFKSEIIKLPPDYEGEVIATLVSSKFNTGKRKSVLYIHGFVDYFFHPHLCEAFHNHGFDFYALDLRKCGRSILPHQRPDYCEDISEYYAEITSSIEIIKRDEPVSLYLLGHSTGGLIAACYMNSGEKRGEIKALILNSPFLDMPYSPFATRMMYTAAKAISKIYPDGKTKKGVSPVYSKSIHKDYYGEWDFNLDWKPINGFPMYYKWMIAIIDAQRSLKHSRIQVPVLLLHSSRSLKPKKHTPEVLQSDVVLNVEDMKEKGPKLGNDVTLVEIKDGQHDLFLSPENVRETAFTEMFNWLYNL
jgi:alpha-beta hydrolase superfamily lysophospholipase